MVVQLVEWLLLAQAGSFNPFNMNIYFFTNCNL